VRNYRGKIGEWGVERNRTAAIAVKIPLPHHSPFPTPLTVAARFLPNLPPVNNDCCGENEE